MTRETLYGHLSLAEEELIVSYRLNDDDGNLHTVQWDSWIADVKDGKYLILEITDSSNNPCTIHLRITYSWGLLASLLVSVIPLVPNSSVVEYQVYHYRDTLVEKESDEQLNWQSIIQTVLLLAYYTGTAGIENTVLVNDIWDSFISIRANLQVEAAFNVLVRAHISGTNIMDIRNHLRLATPPIKVMGE